MSADFKEVIENHPIFKTLVEENAEVENISHRADQLMHVQDGFLYVWSNKESCFYVTNLRMSLDIEEPGVQKFSCSPPPMFEVRSIQFNESGTYVALIGSRGISVLCLPQKWKNPDEENYTQFCKCFPVAERFFTTCIMVQLRQASWHPGSPNHSHLVVLLSDNTVRIYDVTADNQTPTQVHKLGHSNIGSSRFSLVSSAFSISSAIGETAVSFSFAPPVEVQEKRKKILQARRADKDEPPTVLLYPIYLLQGDGDVLLLLTSVTDNRYRKGLMHGPLTMQPPAEDNYGVDACSILVLHHNPTVIAIATASGKIHHCVALATNYDSDDDFTDTQSTASWPASVLSVQSKGLSAEFPAPTLFVYETVEIDLGPKGEEDGGDFESENHTVTLHSDPLLYCRYHCCTRVGVHAVVLPWIDKLTEFFEAADEDKDNLNEIAQDQPCIVEHIVCTKPTPSSAPCLLKGFTFATNPLFGPSLLCLTADNHCMAVPLLTIFKPTPPPLPSYDDDTIVPLTSDNDSSIQTSTMNLMDFQDHIRSILQRDSSQPILRYEASSRDTVMDSEASRLIGRVTQILRKEYILKQKIAQDAIMKRARLLAQQKQQQLDDLDKLKQKRSDLTKTAEQLAEKFEDCVDQQEILSERLAMVLKQTQSKVPVLSKAEIEMSKELRNISDRMKHLENRIKQVKTKHDYQNKQHFEDEKLNSTRRQRTPSVGSSVQVQKFKDILLEEGQKIQDSVKKLNSMKELVDSW
ncbi:nucleoporin 88-like [Styela clava]